MGVFKTYDIRGLYGREIDANLAYRIGRACARFMAGRTYMVGCDARLHSQELYQALARGLVDEGARVLGIGRVTTPQLHFYQIREGCDGGVMVTASHNPPDYHGFKLFHGKGGSIGYSNGLDRIERMVVALKDEPPRGGGSFSEEERIDEYLEFAAGPLKGEKLSLKVVIDPGNGSAGKVFRRLAERVGLEVEIINEEPDGNFPNRDPNPLKAESKKPASRKVLETGADLGALLDGDGDRMLFVDERGEGIENYFLSALIAEELLASQPGAAVVYDLISSRALPERIRELGGKPVVSRVGYTFLYDTMVTSRAVFGSETSGHAYFKVTETFFTESAAYALMILLRLLQRRGKRLSELVAPLKDRYAQSEEINIEVADKEGVLAGVERAFTTARISKLDGISVELPEFWFNIRPSNTEPLLRFRLEAVSREVAEAKSREIKALIQSLGRRA